MLALKERADELRRLVKTDPDPRVRRRAQALFMLTEGASVLEVSRWMLAEATGCGFESLALRSRPYQVRQQLGDLGMALAPRKQSHRRPQD
jgi:hypothetical protein